jgi:hypothetical protein
MNIRTIGRYSSGRVIATPHQHEQQHKY